MIKTMRRPRDVALFPFAITVITPESHHRYCSHEISSRRRRRTTYGLVGKRLLRVYAQPSSAAAEHVGKGRQRPLKDDKRRDEARNLRAKERISASLICRDGPRLATARSGKPRRKNGEGGRRVDRRVSAACHAARADLAPMANGAFVPWAIISLRRPTHLCRGRRLWLDGEPSSTSPHGDRHERFWWASRGRGTPIRTWRT